MITKFMYMDESGDAGFPPPIGASSTQHMVYAGVVVNGEQNKTLKDEVMSLLTIHFRGIEKPEELHYGDLINGRGAYDALSEDEKKELADDVFSMILGVEPTLIATVIDKRAHGLRYPDPVQPKPYIFRSNVERFQYHLSETDSVGIVISDSEEGFVDNALREIVYNATSDGIRLVGTGSTLPSLLNSVMLTPSEMSAGIQIADFIAYAIWSHFERGNSRRYEEIEHLFRDPPGTSFVEPSVLPG